MNPSGFKSKLVFFSIAILSVTGACGLIYEITWQRYIANLIGSEARASAIILSVFLGGLALGYAFFGKISQGRSPGVLLKLTGWLEVGIGIYAIFFPHLYEMAWKMVSTANSTHFEGLSGLLYETSLTAALIIVPTFLMGGTLPLLTQALSPSIGKSSRIHALIYSVNTAGAFLGCLVAGFLLLPHFGLPITLMSVSPLNMIAGLIYVVLGSCKGWQVAEPKLSRSSRQVRLRDVFKQDGLIPCHCIAFICGFIAITLQTALIRVFGLTVGSSEYSFAIVVAVFILMLAVGSARVAKRSSALLNQLWLNQLLVALGVFVLYLLVPYWPYGAHIVRTLFTNVTPSFYVYHGVLFGVLVLFLLGPVSAMGRSMPLLFKSLARDLQFVGFNVGSMYFVNTLGCVLGGILGGYLIYFVFDLDQVFKLCILLAALSSLLAAFLEKGNTNHFPLFGFSGVLVCLLAVSFVPRWDPEDFASGSFRFRNAIPESYQGREAVRKVLFAGAKLDYRRDGPTGTVAVTSRGEPGRDNFSRSILVNGKSDGNTLGDRTTVLLMAHLPALFSRADHKSMAVIGFGTGMTAGTLALYPESEQIHVFEIASLIQQYAPLFDFADHQLSRSPKLRWHIGDAYQQLMGSSQKYSVIASEPSNPWVTGVERLYSKEFLSVASSRLEDGGVYAQWFHVYDISPETLDLVLHTFSSVFPSVRIFASNTADMIILGSNHSLATLNWGELSHRMNIAELKMDLARVSILGPTDLFAREIRIPQEYFSRGAIHTLEFPRLSYAAGYDFFKGSGLSLAQLQDSQELRSWNHRFLASSLLSTWFVERHDKNSVADLVMSVCGTKVASFFEGWRASSRLCRQSLALAVIEGVTQNNGQFSSEELEDLRCLKDQSHASRNGTLRLTSLKAERDLAFFSDYDSEFFKASPQLVDQWGSFCGEGGDIPSLRCRLQYAKTLAGIGEWQKANLEFQTLSAYVSLVPSIELELTASAIREAAIAYPNLAQQQ